MGHGGLLEFGKREGKEDKMVGSDITKRQRKVIMRKGNSRFLKMCMVLLQYHIKVKTGHLVI